MYGNILAFLSQPLYNKCEKDASQVAIYSFLLELFQLSDSCMEPHYELRAVFESSQK